MSERPRAWHRRLEAVGRGLRLAPAASAPGGGAAPVAPAKEEITVTPLSLLPDGEPFGARITALDVARMDARQWELVWAAWLKYALLVFPDQTLSPLDEVAFYQRFPHRNERAPQSVRRSPIPEAPDIGLVGNANLDDHFGVSGRIAPTGAGFQWHPDGSYDGTEPPAVTQLYCLEAPGVGGGVLRWPSGASAEYDGSATVFADARYAYRRLSPDERARADSLTVQYWAGGMFGRGATQPDGQPYPQLDANGLRPVQPPMLPEEPPGGPVVLVSPGPEVPPDEGPNLSAFQDQEQKPAPGEAAEQGAAYPLVWRHPDTGVPAIMAHTLVMQQLQETPTISSGSSGSAAASATWGWEESEAYIAGLLEPVTQPPCIYIHNWQAKDLLVWVRPCACAYYLSLALPLLAARAKHALIRALCLHCTLTDGGMHTGQFLLAAHDHTVASIRGCGGDSADAPTVVAEQLASALKRTDSVEEK